MKQIKMKYALGAATLLAALCNADLAMAHNQGGSLTSSSTAATRSKVDFYQVTCGAGTTKLVARVQDFSPDASLVSLQLKKGVNGIVIASTQDGIAGDGKYGVEITVSGVPGPGVYDMFVNRSGKLAQVYDVDYHCQDSAGGHTGTSIVTKQDQ